MWGIEKGVLINEEKVSKLIVCLVANVRKDVTMSLEAEFQPFLFFSSFVTSTQPLIHLPLNTFWKN